jgi:hypothetical protein
MNYECEFCQIVYSVTSIEVMFVVSMYSSYSTTRLYANVCMLDDFLAYTSSLI